MRSLTFPTLGYSGRLGNQLWQIASTVGRARAKRIVPLFPAEWAYRPFFNCPDTWFGTPQPGMGQTVAYARHLNPSVRPYLQDLALWENVVPEIREVFSFTPTAEAVIDAEWGQYFAQLPKPICAVHVRRGDYVTNPLSTVTSLPVDYYMTGLGVLQPASRVIFSDDIPWCKQQGFQADLYYEGIARPKEQESDFLTAPVLDWIDMGLMTRCDQHVISNSTYSWWGAWMSNDTEPLYPSRWYGSELSSYIDFKLMIPEEWKEIEVVEEC